VFLESKLIQLPFQTIVTADSNCDAYYLNTRTLETTYRQPHAAFSSPVLIYNILTSILTL